MNCSETFYIQIHQQQAELACILTVQVYMPTSAYEDDKVN
jgi:hypothetical protein